MYGKKDLDFQTIPEWVDAEKFQQLSAELLASSGFHAPRHFEHNDHFRGIIKRVYRGLYTPSPSTIDESSDTESSLSDSSDSSDSDDVGGATKTSERAPTPIVNEEGDVARAKVWSHFCLKLNAVLFAMAGLFFAGVYFCDVCDSACNDGTTP